MNLILNPSTANISRAGSIQLALAAVLFGFLAFTSEWRSIATLEVAIYFTLSGSSLLMYGSLKHDLPLRKLASTWLPISPWVLSLFLLLFGSGIGLAEAGHDAAGIALMAAGYISLGAKSMLRLIDGATDRSGRDD